MTSSLAIGQVGGVETVVREVAREFSRRGITTTIMAPSLKHLEKTTVGAIEFEHIFSVGSHSRVVFPLSIRKALALCKKADFVYVHSIESIFSILVLSLSLLVNKRVSAATLGIFDLMKHPKRRVAFLGFGLLILSFFPLCLVHAIQSKNVVEWKRLRRLFRNKVKLIPDGLPDYYFSEARGTSAHGGISVLYVGRISRLKGIHSLVQDWGYVLGTFPGATLTIVGTGDKEELEALTELSVLHGCGVRVMGRVSESEKISFYDSADLVIVPSLVDIVESFSIVTSEAWARRKPVLASNVGALRSRIVHGVNGYFINTMSPPSIVSGIQWAIEHKTIIPPADVVSWKEVCNLILRELYGVGEAPILSSRRHCSRPSPGFLGSLD